jgi:F-type H+-transporting ATPase subunit b
MLSKKNTIMVTMFLLAGLPLLASGGHGQAHHGPDFIELLARVLNVSIFAWILYHFLRQPVADFFSSRRRKIIENLEMAKRSREEAQKRLAEIDEKMAGLEHELEAIAQKAREDAEKESRRLLLKAEEETEKIKAQAAKDMEQAKAEAFHDVRKYVVDIAMNRVESVIAEKITTEDQERLIEEFAEKLGA